ncbi:MAG: ATPase, T2SS/T4P/T4SS family [Mariprofundaceae bacterium]|nr:ATPase, T2SS/T4P/T4SS family [Mariprofundaceae bacterium]
MLLAQQRYLVERGVVSQEQVDDALQMQETERKGLLFSLLTVDGVDANAVLQTLARIYKVPYLDVSNFKPSDNVLKVCPEKLCLDFSFIPVGEQGGELVVAMGNPMDFAALDALQFKLGRRVKAIFARPDAVQRKIRELYQGDAAFEDAMSSLEEDGSFSTESDEDKDDTDIAALKKGAADSPIIKLVNGIMVQAMKMGSSDIHIEAGERVSVVRMRVDGRLRSALKFPVKAHPLVLSRIKIISNLDISNTRTPQDGRTRVKLWGKSFDMRVSTLPSMHGEKAVLRILDKSGLSLDLNILGFEKLADQRVRECIARPTGAVLVTGPTGSGKTTTLYSFLHHINDAESNLITVEDPVEFQLKGINQVQVNSKTGMTFAAALRSILRQDPDVVMVGEIRDEETAAIALHAAQTGHLVLSTLHTNDAPSTITRLIEMGIESSMLASSLNLVVAQRLARRLCAKCKKKARPDKEFCERFDIPESLMFYEPVGCKACMNIGYKGRLGVHEVLYVNDRMKELIARGAADSDLMLVAREEGMFCLFEDGLNKALAGLTSIAEVLRNSTPPEGFKLAERLTSDGSLMSLGEAVKMRDVKRSSLSVNSGKKTILVVDDSTSIRNLVKFVLQSDGFEVLEAEDGQQGWDILQRLSSSIDLVVTDYEMPNMSGLEFVEKVREHHGFGGIPLILLTSRKDEDDEVFLLDSGADDYICKPVEPMKLQARVRKILTMYARISAAAQGRS